MKRMTFLLAFVLLLSSCNSGEFTSSKTLKLLHADDIKGMLVDQVIEKYGIPYKIEDSLTNGQYNREAFNIKFHDSLTVSFTYMRPINNDPYKKNDVVILTFVNRFYNTQYVPVFQVEYIAR